MIEVGQLRAWKKQPAGGQFYNIPDGTLCLIISSYDQGVDAYGRQRPRTYTVMIDNNRVGGPPTPWFYDKELEEHTVLVE